MSDKLREVVRVTRVTVRAKGQITLPAPIIRLVGLKEGDVIEVDYRPDGDIIVLRPVAVVPRPRDGDSS